MIRQTLSLVPVLSVPEQTVTVVTVQPFTVLYPRQIYLPAAMPNISASVPQSASIPAPQQAVQPTAKPADLPTQAEAMPQPSPARAAAESLASLRKRLLRDSAPKPSEVPPPPEMWLEPIATIKALTKNIRESRKRMKAQLAAVATKEIPDEGSPSMARLKRKWKSPSRRNAVEINSVPDERFPALARIKRKWQSTPDPDNSLRLTLKRKANDEPVVDENDSNSKDSLVVNPSQSPPCITISSDAEDEMSSPPFSPHYGVDADGNDLPAPIKPEPSDSDTQAQYAPPDKMQKTEVDSDLEFFYPEIPKNFRRYPRRLTCGRPTAADMAALMAPPSANESDGWPGPSKKRKVDSDDEADLAAKQKRMDSIKEVWVDEVLQLLPAKKHEVIRDFFDHTYRCEQCVKSGDFMSWDQYREHAKTKHPDMYRVFTARKQSTKPFILSK